MDKVQLEELVSRLRISGAPTPLQEEVIATIRGLRNALEEVHISAKQNGDRSAEYISGMALGKPGYVIGDMGL